MTVTHDLKILPEYFHAVCTGDKPFEVRQNDRSYKCGDLLKLNEWTPDAGYTGNSIHVEVTYILSDPAYVKDGFVIMGLNIAP
ncbi:DUF3850 domain-containing protein [Paenibacillus polymyxa]|nr:DUF3850 domain-containing protein [Paenibacillus polymyxa]